jgi:hypothetical protein
VACSSGGVRIDDEVVGHTPGLYPQPPGPKCFLVGKSVPLAPDMVHMWCKPGLATLATHFDLR